MYTNRTWDTRVVRLASLLLHPRRSREFPARQERLVTAQELARLGL
ncbi:hypothetical protein MMAD_41790 [Mycolicibacterium madagascariense]|uniref:Uncharacterized protein n=1 Tax=Mycolicibacterium madagascariense TaxID=212765 RepID=A0A7I7XKY6_9MYCO|nr:hypothetical protein MMAD_41790 [Mycolicibacterium madagascariense]